MSKDPFYKREKQRYSKPVASREYILEIITKHNNPVSLKYLCDELSIIDPEQQEGVSRRLKAMINDGQLISYKKDKYKIMPRDSLKSGIVRGNKEGTGYCIFDDASKPVIIRPQQMRRVFDGDKVIVSERPRITNEPECIIIEVTKRNTQAIVGYLHTTHNSMYVVPMNRRNQHHSIAITSCPKGIAEGSLVEVSIITQPERVQMPSGKVTKVLDDKYSGMEKDIALLNHRLRYQWPDAIQKELDQISCEIDKKAINKRINLEELPFVTIDGDDSKDFDDAVFCRPNGKSYNLIVAIADVTSYVLPGTELDTEAQLRGNSVYFPREVIPMLPEKLSNNLCSLVPDATRLALVCDMEITKKGEVASYCFYEAVFKSHARLTYNQVSEYLASKENKGWSSGIKNNINSLEKVYQGLLSSRNIRGALAIELPELKFNFDDGKVKYISKTHRTISHKIIEEAMLAANVCAAKLLEEYKMPALYRTHQNPDPDRLVQFRTYLKQSGLTLLGGENPQPKHFLNLIEQLVDIPHADAIYMQLLGTLMKAEYSPNIEPHFGLAYESYCHFTSPIRRYPDLLVHRAIRTLIHSRGTKTSIKKVRGAGMWKASESYPYDRETLCTIGIHCTDTETRAEDASRDVKQYLRCTYLQQFLGNEFEGIVKAVTKFGLFVEMPETFCEGLVHISKLGDDYYIFDEASISLKGESSGKTYSIGSIIKVRLVRVDVDQGMIDLEPTELDTKKPRKKKKAFLNKKNSSKKYNKEKVPSKNIKKTKARVKKNK